MLEPALHRALTATGYLRDDGEPAASAVTLANGAPVRRGNFQPDVRWHGENLSVYFKYAANPSNDEISSWQQEVWNEGSVPLLWLIGPGKTELYNGFAMPQRPSAAIENRLGVFGHDTLQSFAPQSEQKGLQELNAVAGRLSMETGRFWQAEPRIDRSEAVDKCLLRDIASLEQALLKAGLPIDDAQALIGRSIFAKYLVDRAIIDKLRLQRLCGRETLQGVLRDRSAATRLFGWLTDNFNGDMFPTDAKMPVSRHLHDVANFLDGDDMRSGQRSLFPYRFEIIPIELISAICEQFAHSTAASEPAAASGVHYTPLAAVQLILDEVMQGLRGDETVLDITCGSGIFLVETFRRLVKLKSGHRQPTRAAIRGVLYNQIHGVDISPVAIRVAALSLYLAALELDPTPNDSTGIKFKQLVGKTLLIGDAHNIGSTAAGKAALLTRGKPKRFDLIVGNPPFTEHRDRGQSSTPDMIEPPRDRSLVFAQRARLFAHDRTRFGMILRATPFFSRRAGRKAAQDLVESLSPVTIVNLSSCSSWLFERANVPVVALATRYRPKQSAKHMMLVQAHWSPGGKRGHQFDITAADVQQLHVASWKRNAGLFKAAFYGSYHDLLLLDKLRDCHESLKQSLEGIEAKFSEGLKVGKIGRKDATHLLGLPFWRSTHVEPFRVGHAAPFSHRLANRPRDPETYKAPLLLVREFVGRPMAGMPRVMAAVSTRDGVFANSVYGATLPNDLSNYSHVLATVLCSSLAAWYFIMTGSTFGVWARRLLLEDLISMPTPNMDHLVYSPAGRHLRALAEQFATQAPDREGWQQLDEAVFDLYELDERERMVVRDGHFRASWQWEQGWLQSAAVATWGDLEAYARAFQSMVNAWLVAAGRRLRAEIYDLPHSAPVRIIRFDLEDGTLPSPIDRVPLKGSLQSLLQEIGLRADLPIIMDSLAEAKVLRITSAHDVVVIKPASRRHWLGADALKEARDVLEESFRVDGG